MILLLDNETKQMIYDYDKWHHNPEIEKRVGHPCIIIIQDLREGRKIKS